MLIKRELYLSKIRNYYESDLIKVITGIRRAGKSKILEQIIVELKQMNIPDHQIIYVNFEDLDYEHINDAYKLNEFVQSKTADDQKYYLLFDEIQHVKSFEKAIASFKATKMCPFLLQEVTLDFFRENLPHF